METGDGEFFSVVLTVTEITVTDEKRILFKGDLTISGVKKEKGSIEYDSLSQTFQRINSSKNNRYRTEEIELDPDSQTDFNQIIDFILN